MPMGAGLSCLIIFFIWFQIFKSKVLNKCREQSGKYFEKIADTFLFYKDARSNIIKR